jgi:hypothetical protein
MKKLHKFRMWRLALRKRCCAYNKGNELIFEVIILIMSELSAKITDFWSVFKYYLFVNSTEEPTYLLTRQHVGSLAAFAIAGYNTFLLRQKIIKNAIHLTKSNNPKIVIGTSFFVAAFYYVGLTIVWHIPSFFSELAVRVYCSA